MLLKADTPLAVADFAFAAAFDTPREAIHVWATHSDLHSQDPAAPYRWAYVLSVNTPSALEMTLAELGATPGLDYAVLDFWAANGSAPTAASVTRVGADGGGRFAVPMSPPQANVKGGSDAGTYQVLAPIMKSGWCLLGEAKKIVSAAKRRFVSVIDQPDPPTLAVTLAAASDEAVTLWLLAPAAAAAVGSAGSGAGAGSSAFKFKLVEVNCPKAKSCVAPDPRAPDCDSQEMVVRCGGAGSCTCTAV